MVNSIVPGIERYPFGLLAINGNLPNISACRRFGYNPNLAEGTDEDVWPYGGVMTYSTTADIDTISSSDAGDTGTVTINGLDANWDRVSQVVTLAGTAGVTLSTPIIRIGRMTSNSTLSGDVYLYPAGSDVTAGVPDNASDIRGYVVSSHNTSMMCHISCPRRFITAFLNGGISIGGKKNGFVTLYAYYREFNGPWLLIDVRELSTSGTSYANLTFNVPVIMSPKSDFKLVANASIAAMTATMSLYCVTWSSIGGDYDIE